MLFALPMAPQLLRDPHVVFRDGLCVGRGLLSCRDVFFCFQ